MKDIPITICNRNRVITLAALTSWLTDSGYSNIHVIDNESTYPPLLDFYKEYDGKAFIVHYVGWNGGSKILWLDDDKWAFLRTPPFIYSDSDVVPTGLCPTDVVEFLYKVAQQHPEVNKVGLSLKIDDIPDHYSQAELARTWESQFWENQIDTIDDVPIYKADVDTTFALYMDSGPFGWGALRTGPPYIARHYGWYTNSRFPLEEVKYYEAHADITHSWGVDKTYPEYIHEYAKKVNDAKLQS